MAEKTYIEIDASPWLTQDGFVEVCVYIGDACEPCYMEKESLIDLIDKELHSFTSPLTNKIAHYHVEEVEDFLKHLKCAYKHAKARAEEIGYDDE
jgi:hypothetical protein